MSGRVSSFVRAKRSDIKTARRQVLTADAGPGGISKFALKFNIIINYIINIILLLYELMLFTFSCGLVSSFKVAGFQSRR